MRQTASSVLLDLRPRFPLFGGWKTHYILGYALPASDFLFNDGNQFVLRIPFVGHIYDNSVIEDATVRIVLPEGASNIDVKLPFSVTRERDQIKKTYLDTFGRTVIVLRKTNLVEEHIQDIEIHYTFSRFFMLQEPLLLVSFIFFLCFLVIIYSRLDFSLSSSPVKNVSHKASSVLLQIIKHQEARESIYGGYDNAISKVKGSKDVSSFQAALKKLNADHKQETATIATLAQKLKEEGGSQELLSKIEDLQGFDRLLKDQQQSHAGLVEKFAKNPATKAVVTDSEKKLTASKQDLANKLRGITTTLMDVAYSS
jgi:oligosaccharyltransferase complex subunit alpha (ribophorin I)